MNLQSALSEDWKSYNLSEIITLIGGGTPKTTNTEYWGGDIPWLSVKDFNNDFRYVYTTEKNITQLGLEQSSTTLLQKDDIIISARGTVGETAMIPYPMAFNQSCYGIRAKRDFVDSIFLYYLLKNSIKNLKNNAHGSVFDTITRETFDGISIDLPPLPTQKKIAAILSSLDDKIELNTRMNKVLEEIARALFHRWFVEFEFPNAEGKPYKSTGGKMVESEMGMVPEGWKVGKLGNFVIVQAGYSYKGTDLQPSSDVLATIKNFDRNGGFKLGGFKEINISERVKPSHYVNLYDVIVAHTDLTQKADIIGNCEMILSKSNYNQIIISMDLVKVVPKLPQMNNFLLASILSSKSFKNHALSYINGTTVLHLNKKAIPEYKIIIPNDLSLFEKMGEILSPIYQFMALNIEENLRLSKLRDILLPKLMSGEIEV